MGKFTAKGKVITTTSPYAKKFHIIVVAMYIRDNPIKWGVVKNIDERKEGVIK